MRDIELEIRNYFNSNPVSYAQKVSEELSISRQVVSKYLTKLKRNGFLTELNMGGTRIFLLKKLLKNLNGNDSNG
jgi:biotin operon repressor